MGRQSLLVVGNWKLGVLSFCSSRYIDSCSPAHLLTMKMKINWTPIMLQIWVWSNIAKRKFLRSFIKNTVILIYLFHSLFFIENPLMSNCHFLFYLARKCPTYTIWHALFYQYQLIYRWNSCFELKDICSLSCQCNYESKSRHNGVVLKAFINEVGLESVFHVFSSFFLLYNNV